MNCDEEHGILVSNDLDLFNEEIQQVHRNKTKIKDQDFHNFHGSSTTDQRFSDINQVDLRQFFNNKIDFDRGMIHSAIMNALSYDSLKYQNMSVIPKLSRRQKKYQDYLTKVRKPFNILKASSNKCNESNNTFDFNMVDSDTFALVNTIPEYLQLLNKTNDIYRYKHINTTLNQFRLALLHGYPIITGLHISQNFNTMEESREDMVVLIIGFNDTNFLIKRFVDIPGVFDNSYYFTIDCNYVLDNCFDSCILYSVLGCNNEINLGFL